MWSGGLCTDSLVPSRAKDWSPSDPMVVTYTCMGWQVFGQAPWAPGTCHSYSLPQPLLTTHHSPFAERYVAISHIGAAPSPPTCK